MKAFDAMLMVTDEATERFAPLMTEDEAATSRMESICNMIDWFAEQTYAEEFDIHVDEDTTDITINVVCTSFTAEPDGECSIFFDLLGTAKSVTFSATSYEDSDLSVGFRYDGIWCKT